MKLKTKNLMNDYEKVSKRYLYEAKRYLRKRNYLQAGEKFWGAVATMVKAVAEKNGFRHDGHADLFRVIKNLTIKTGEEDLIDYFAHASTLHQNFYENWLVPEQVIRFSESAEKLIEKLTSLLHK